MGSSSMPRLHPLLRFRAAARRAEPPVISTLVPPVERPHVDAAGAGLYRAVHRSSLLEVVADLRERRASAVMVSLGAWHPTARPALMRLVREFPNVPAFAFLARPDARAPQVALQLGQCGVRAVLEASQAHGWAELRRALSAQHASDIRRRALEALARELPALQPDALTLFERIFLDAATITSTRDLARVMHVNSSSLMSRFFRLKLPSAKTYLAMARLMLAADRFERPGSTITEITHVLHYSSPQSFGRHTRRMLGISAATFREQYDGDGMLALYLERLVRPHRDALARLSPTGAHEGRAPVVLPGGRLPM